MTRSYFIEILIILTKYVFDLGVRLTEFSVTVKSVTLRFYCNSPICTRGIVCVCVRVYVCVWGVMVEKIYSHYNQCVCSLSSISPFTSAPPPSLILHPPLKLLKILEPALTQATLSCRLQCMKEMGYSKQQTVETFPQQLQLMRQ